MSYQHTPGPFTVENMGDDCTPRLEIFAAGDCDTHPIAVMCHVPSCRDDFEVAATAILIASAPDMLACIKRNRQALGLVDPSRCFSYMQVMDLMRNDMDAMIAIAEGS